jgi:hypothetical protein
MRSTAIIAFAFMESGLVNRSVTDLGLYDLDNTVIRIGNFPTAWSNLSRCPGA